MNEEIILFQYQVKTKSQHGTRFYYFYADTDIENYLNNKNIKYVRYTKDTALNKKEKRIKELFKENKQLKKENENLRETIKNDDLTINKLCKENKILRENAEHNDKVVDKYWWENKYLKQENEQLHHKRFEILNFIEENKNKRYAPYGDNEDEDFEICLNEDEIDVLIRIVKDEYDYEN